MALGITGTPHQTTASGQSSRTGTYTPESGSRRLGVIAFSRGYGDGLGNIFPTSITWGGQTINQVQATQGGDPDANGEIAVYVATESQIAAMSGGAYTCTFTRTMSASHPIGVIGLTIIDAAQTLADFGSTNASTTVTLTTTSGDFCLGFIGWRGDFARSLGTGMTEVVAMTSGSSLTDVIARCDSRTATGASTDVTTDAATVPLQGIAIGEDTGGGGSSFGLVATIYNNIQ